MPGRDTNRLIRMRPIRAELEFFLDFRNKIEHRHEKLLGQSPVI